MPKSLRLQICIQLKMNIATFHNKRRTVSTSMFVAMFNNSLNTHHNRHDCRKQNRNTRDILQLFDKQVDLLSYCLVCVKYMYKIHSKHLLLRKELGKRLSRLNPFLDLRSSALPRNIFKLTPSPSTLHPAPQQTTHPTNPLYNKQKQ